MGRLQVEIRMVADDGTTPLEAKLDEPTRLDVARDPLYVFGRLDSLTARALDELHRQAVVLAGPDRAHGNGAL